MKRLSLFGLGICTMLGLSFWIGPSVAGADLFGGGAHHVVFVQTDNPSGNQIVAYDRSNTGTLTLANTYSTGGLGGIAPGSVVDHLASQGSLAYDPSNAMLYAVNAGSNTVSVFSVQGDQLVLRQVLNSGGVFPVSIATHGRLVYVLNAENGGSVQGYVLVLDRLIPIPGSARSLGLGSAALDYVHTPGQVAFSPDGSQLIVTTKESGSDIDVFRVGFFGLLSPSPVVNTAADPVPFAVSFDSTGHLVVANAGDNSLASYELNANGTVSLIGSVGTGQSATCWVALDRGFLYTSNAGSANLSGFQDANGGLTLLTPPTPTDQGTVDASASTDGQFLYVQTGGSGIVDEFQVTTNGSLSEIGSVLVPGAAGGEGIVAL